MTTGFEGKVALVTGAGSGIGAATAERLVREGVGGLILTDRDGAAVEAVAERLAHDGVRLLVRAADVADEPAWLALEADVRETFERLDYAVANAGVAHGEALADHSFEAWRRVLSTNLDGTFLTLRSALRLICAGERGGAIVVVSSATALKADLAVGAYGASKAGTLYLARVAAKEGAPDKIRVNAILPGGVKTPMWRSLSFFQDLVKQAGDEQAAFGMMAAMGTPLGLFATPDEIAGQIAFLLSDAAANITGTSLVVDSGYTL